MIKVHNPETITIEPNLEFKPFAEFPAGHIPDMIILHEHNVHYSLIIPEDCRLAENGGLDYQRCENAKNVKKDTKEKLNNKTIQEIITQDEIELNGDYVVKDSELNKINEPK